MNPLEKLRQKLGAIEEAIGYFFYDKDLLVLAFVHRSFLNENRALLSQHNERLEFLGDSVLGLIASHFLYTHLPDCPEGDLSQLRSRIVDASSCALYLQKLALADCILLGRGEKMGEGRLKVSILADVFEALIGAIYLDGGIEAARTFFFARFRSEVEKAIGDPPRNYKAELQDYSQKRYQKPPVYKVLEETGPDHAKVFRIAVYIEGEEWGSGMGISKKEAEQKAAFNALTRIAYGQKQQ